MSFPSAYAQGQLADFFALAPNDIASALELPRTVNRPALVAALRQYAQTLDAPKAVMAALEKLEHPNSKVVVTGQQAGLLLGPNYTLSKAITAINLAKQLSTNQQPVVSIFWVASQDHDVDEVNHTYLLDMNETLHRLAVDLPSETPIGKIPMQASWLQEVTKFLQSYRSPERHKQQCLALLQDTAKTSKTFADWFAAILYQLLGEHGLIILNPLEPDIAALFASILEAELEHPKASSEVINHAGQRLGALGFEPQLKRSDGATNLFLEEHNKRHLLRFDGKHYSTQSQRYSLKDLKTLLQSDPTRITPAAGLRPITQDSILPTSITVLGPGELRYFAQLKGVYELHNIAMPLTWSRATATILEPPVVRIMQKFNLSYAELAKDLKGFKEKHLLELNGYGKTFDETHQTLERSLLSLLESLQGIDPTLLGTLNRSEGHIRKTLDILKHKSAKALEKQDDVIANQFDRLEKHLFPNAIPQERLISPFGFFLKFGIASVLEEFLSLPTQGDHLIRI
jgi:bacillithiol synthase